MESFSPVDLTISDIPLSDIAVKVTSKKNTWVWWLLAIIFAATLIYTVVESNKEKPNSDRH